MRKSALQLKMGVMAFCIWDRREEGIEELSWVQDATGTTA